MNQLQHKPNGGALAMERGLLVVSAEAQELETLLTVQEVAGILKVSSGWVRDHAGRKQPHLRCVRVGDLLRFRPRDVKEFIEQWCQ
ncbi:MAG: helix-turn-helix domain-containing protein [Acidobacteria bacterium]|nr:helix-turn-helix domain-containing protein [Acidobacteriota bacterium]